MISVQQLSEATTSVASWAFDGSGNAINSTSNALNVFIAGGALGSTVDESTFVAGTSNFSPDGGVFNDSLAILTSGQQGTARMTEYRALHVNLRSAISNVELGSAASPIFSSDAADGSVAPGTAASKSMLGGGVFNTTAPTLTNGQQAAVQMDASGNIKVSLAASSDSTAIPVSNANDNSSTATAPASASQSLTAATDVTVLALNTARKGFILVNTGITPIFIGFGAAASATNWTIQILPGNTYEPQKNYTGAIHAFSVAANSIKATELT